MTIIFHLEEPIKRINLFNSVFQYFSLNLNGIKIILGEFAKENQIKNEKQFLEKEDFWNKSEKKEIKNFLEKDQISRLQEWVLARSMIKYGIGYMFKDQIKIPFNNITIESDKRNKPKLKIKSKNIENKIKKECEEIVISISHSNKMIYVALTSNQIGIDCEDIHLFSEKFREKFVKNDEFNQLKSTMNIQISNSRDIFDTIIWCIKESTLKIIRDAKLANISQVKIEIRDQKIISSYPSINYEFVNFINIKNDSILVLTFIENKVAI
ncbi:4'-phosphopantetheinyl transferase superfamily protein [Promethearchaeum syntrophicum]|uniref:4'-phosphopantetheinyl transferase superfamily protein n=1 Tax=Promethearchaeum syntrophicum TaxID=2594042 RepID=A0A5B9D8A6_9ARCH|nr:4'-phosphopantetheinyl transferase superfamily protein [Candidatus Prometheoarchaeum syntrophicum]